MSRDIGHLTSPTQEDSSKNKNQLIHASGDASLKNSHQKEVKETPGHYIISTGRKKETISEKNTETGDVDLNAEEKDYFLSSCSESDRETLGSSSSELANLRSPSRDSLNVGFDSSPVSSSPVHVTDSTPTNNALDPDHKFNIQTSNSHLNSQVQTPSGVNKDLQRHLTQTVSSPLQKPSIYPASLPLHLAATPQANCLKQDKVKPLQTETKSPVRTKQPTHQSSLPTSSLNAKLTQQRPDDHQLDNPSHARFIAPYSSQRLKPRGDAAKRSIASSKDLTNLLGSQEEDSIKEDLAADSLDFEKDSLDLELDQPRKDYPHLKGDDIKNQSQDCATSISKDILVEEQSNVTRKESSPLPDSTTRQKDLTYFNPTAQVNRGREDSDVTSKPGYLDLASVDNRERGLPATVVDKDDSHTSHTPYNKTVTGDCANISKSHDGDTNNSSELTPVADTKLDESTTAILTNSQTSATRSTGQEKAVFILKSDHNKSRQSRQSSAQTSGRLSRHNQAQTGPDTDVTTAATSATRHPGRVTTSAHKVYVTSPTFSDDEDGMYRLVNSRLDGVDDDRLDTYRELDMAAIQNQENFGPQGGGKVNTDKRGSYNDGGRYEDRGNTVRGEGSQKIPEDAGLYNPYGIRMSGPIRPDAHINTSSKDGSNWPGQQENSYPPASRSQPVVNRPGDGSFHSSYPDFSETNNPQPGRIIQHNPQIMQQPNSTTQPPQPNQLPVRQTRARGISLPTGPSYDPRDEEDLQRETSYQQGLRMRVEDGLKKVQEVEIPKVPLNPGQDGSQDFARDSLDYYNDDATARAFVEAFKPDPSDSFDLQQHQFRNPPPLPQAYTDHSQPTDHAYPAGNSRLNNVNFDSEDYVDYEDIRNHRLNPRVQQRFYQPQPDANPNRDVMDSDRYVDVNTTARSEPSGHQETTPRYQAHAQTDRTDHTVGHPGGQRSKKPVQEEPMEAVQPKAPKYDYVTNNKEDYGRPQPKSYTHIHEVTKEEKEKLSEIFIQPKPKPKQGILKKRGQGQTSHRGSENIDPNQGDDEYREMSPAEQVWAQRSASLAKRVDHKNGHGRQRVGPGALQKFNSDSSLNKIRPQQVPPDKRAFLTEMPTPPSQESSHHNQVSLPMSPRHSDIQVLPVSSQIILDDGQRISVDVNLKLISPPIQYQPYQDPAPQQPPGYYGAAGPQQPPGYYGGAARGRQYPAVTQYDDENYNNGLQALEYIPADYGQDYGYVSPRERYSADEALRALSESRTEINPYGKIPPIPSNSDPGHPSSAPLPDQGGSYIDMYRKQKGKEHEKPWYRVYGLKDYRKMQKEVRLGTLGPDLDSDAIKERREKFQRQSEYAKLVMERNKNDLAHRKPPAFPRPKEENDILNRRKVAVEYAKSVPKPVAKPQPNEYNNYELASEKSPIAKHHRKPGDMLGPGPQKHMTPSPRQAPKQKEMDVIDLEKLRQRYEEDKQNEALIRRNTSNSLPKGEKYY